MKQGSVLKSFSLIEVLLAIGIFTFGILSAFALIPLSTKISAQTENTTVAIGLAQSVMDNKINQNYDTITPGDTGIVDYEADTTSPYYKFKSQTIIQNINTDFISTPTDTGLKSVKVIISWQQGSQNKNYELFTTVARK
ncbi:MAG: hypothetical protein WCW17_00475 [Patescibacteria group bacterium]|jgi:type II secretory pathway pseudopilin PulG